MGVPDFVIAKICCRLLNLGGFAKIDVGGSSNLQFAVARLTPGGTPDTAFSGDGKLSINFGSVGFGGALVVRPDRKIVIAGSVQSQRRLFI